MGAGRGQEKGSWLPQFIQRRRILLAIGISILIPIIRFAYTSMLGQGAQTPASVALRTSYVQCAIHLMVLAGLCWPWIIHAVAFRVSLAGVTTVLFVGSVNAVVQNRGFTRLVPYLFPVGVVCAFIAFLAVSMCVTSGAVFMRNRYWPIYPEGACKGCGYDLTGNVSGVCPECGVSLLATGDVGRSEQVDLD